MNRREPGKNLLQDRRPAKVQRGSGDKHIFQIDVNTYEMICGTKQTACLLEFNTERHAKRHVHTHAQTF